MVKFPLKMLKNRGFSEKNKENLKFGRKCKIAVEAYRSVNFREKNLFIKSWKAQNIPALARSLVNYPYGNSLNLLTNWIKLPHAPKCSGLEMMNTVRLPDSIPSRRC